MEKFKKMNESEKFNKIFQLLLNLQDHQNLESKKMESFLTEMKSIKCSNEKIIKEINTITASVDTLETKNQCHSIRLNLIEQESLNTYTSILGTPDIPDEKLETTIRTICSKIKYEFKTVKDMKECYIKRNKINKTSHITLRFYDERDKLLFDESFKKNCIKMDDKLKVSDSPQFKGNKLYIKDKLTWVNQQLKKECKKYSESIFKYVWDSHGKIFVREDDNTNIFQIGSINELDKIVNTIKDCKNNEVEKNSTNNSQQAHQKSAKSKSHKQQ